MVTYPASAVHGAARPLPGVLAVTGLSGVPSVAAYMVVVGALAMVAIAILPENVLLNLRKCTCFILRVIWIINRTLPASSNPPLFLVLGPLPSITSALGPVASPTVAYSANSQAHSYISSVWAWLLTSSLITG